jgi:hypothetical protein
MRNFACAVIAKTESFLPQILGRAAALKTSFDVMETVSDFYAQAGLDLAFQDANY